MIIKKYLNEIPTYLVYCIVAFANYFFIKDFCQNYNTYDIMKYLLVLAYIVLSLFYIYIIKAQSNWKIRKFITKIFLVFLGMVILITLSEMIIFILLTTLIFLAYILEKVFKYVLKVNFDFTDSSVLLIAIICISLLFSNLKPSLWEFITLFITLLNVVMTEESIESFNSGIIWTTEVKRRLAQLKIFIAAFSISIYISSVGPYKSFLPDNFSVSHKSLNDNWMGVFVDNLFIGLSKFYLFVFSLPFSIIVSLLFLFLIQKFIFKSINSRNNDLEKFTSKYGLDESQKEKLKSKSTSINIETLEKEILEISKAHIIKAMKDD